MLLSLHVNINAPFVRSKYPDACLIWIDAHADINTVESTDSGNLHGMPVSFLLGLPGNDPVAQSPFGWLKPVLKANKLVYIGLRDVDNGEKKILRDHGIKAFSMHDVDKHGIGKVVELALDHVNPKRDLPIHLSFDVDALDPSVAPSTGTPVSCPGHPVFLNAELCCLNSGPRWTDVP